MRSAVPHNEGRRSRVTPGCPSRRHLSVGYRSGPRRYGHRRAAFADEERGAQSVRDVREAKAVGPADEYAGVRRRGEIIDAVIAVAGHVTARRELPAAGAEIGDREREE